MECHDVISASKIKYYFLIVLIYLLVVAIVPVQSQGTRVGFYSRTCPRAELIVRSTVESHFRSDQTVAPGLLRMHVHDCLIQGCDASVLIDGPDAEKTAPPNLGLRGYGVVDDAKSKLEAACPGVVSCADILALAARDAVVLTRGFTWAVPTGRRDCRISLASEASNLPGPTNSIDVQKEKFAKKGLNNQDLVNLVGTDYTTYANRFDTTFFTNLKNDRGILESDQKLWTEASTRTFVESFTGITGILTFNVVFGKSMVKMSNIGVKTGNHGEIRKVCSVIN